MKTTDAITQMLVKACFMISLANTERALPPQKKNFVIFLQTNNMDLSTQKIFHSLKSSLRKHELFAL